MPTVRLKKLDTRHDDRSIMWAEEYTGPGLFPRIRPDDMISVKYQGSTIRLKVLMVYDESEFKAEIQSMEPNNESIDPSLYEGMKIRVMEEHIHTCEC